MSVDSVCPLPTYEGVEAEVKKELEGQKNRDELVRSLTEFILTSIYEVVLPRVDAEPVSARVASQRLGRAADD